MQAANIIDTTSKRSKSYSNTRNLNGVISVTWLTSCTGLIAQNLECEITLLQPQQYGSNMTVTRSSAVNQTIYNSYEKEALRSNSQF